MLTNPRALNHKWQGPLLIFYRSWSSSCNQSGLLFTGLRGHVWPCQPGWRPYTAFNGAAAPPDYRRQKLPRMLPAQVLTHGGPAMAGSREPTASAQLTRWGLASPFNHHTVVHWPGSQLRQKQLKINSIQLPANNWCLSVNLFVIYITHQNICSVVLGHLKAINIHFLAGVCAQAYLFLTTFLHRSKLNEGNYSELLKYKVWLGKVWPFPTSKWFKSHRKTTRECTKAWERNHKSDLGALSAPWMSPSANYVLFGKKPSTKSIFQSAEEGENLKSA